MTFPNTQNRPTLVYIPTSILLAVIIYLHKHFNHPSQTQTHKEFCSLYYHPLAKTAIKKCSENVWYVQWQGTARKDKFRET